jgi:chromosome partitioning protein
MTSSPNAPTRVSPTHTIAIYNHKGGVGKTTVSLNLSVCLAAAGYRCLLVDIDPQQSSTTVLSRTGASPNLVDVIRKQAVIEDALHETVVQNLWIIPSTRALTLLETGLDDRVRPNHGLKRYLTFSEDRFDFIVIDCPPAMGLLSLSALIAADSVLIPTTSGAFSIQGVQRTVETVNALRGGLSPGLVVNGILISLFEGTRRDQQTMKDLNTQFSGLTYRNRIRFDPEILKAEVKRALHAVQPRHPLDPGLHLPDGGVAGPHPSSAPAARCRFLFRHHHADDHGNAGEAGVHDRDRRP